jgi:HAMP domain-containing protein
VGQGYTPVIIANRPGASLYALSGNPASPSLTAESLPSSVKTDLGRSSGSFADFSTVPSSGDNALVLEGMNPNSGPPVVYVGVETPTSLFLGSQTADELTVVWLALTALLATWLLVLLFVNRFVRRPVAQLSAGVARIAGGDYSSDIPVRSRDELGVLARQVNQMRGQIQPGGRGLRRGRVPGRSRRRGRAPGARGRPARDQCQESRRGRGFRRRRRSRRV